jgi:dTDP-4-dehydrorhamnose reductase
VFDTWGQNFAKTILRAAHDRDSLNIVSDQWGSPTRAALIADVTAQALRTLLVTPSAESLAGVYHLAASGFTSWHGYALLLLQEARQLGLPLRVRPETITAVPTSACPTRARRPANSRLDTSKLRHTFGLNLPPWQDGVRAVVAELAAARTSLEQH